MTQLTYGSLFTGIGGFDLGFDRAGMRNSWQIENDKDCNRVLERHWHGTKRFGDITKVDPRELGRPDVVCGGFPCQDLSVAGRRAGLAGERSGLWSEFHRIVAGVKPRFVVIENVPGLLSSNEGRDMELILGGLEELGYCVSWTTLDSQYFGVAQRRNRVFIVGSLGDGSCAQILFEPESVRGDTPPSRETREGVASCLGRKSANGSNERGDNSANLLAKCLNSERDGYNDGSDQTYIPILESGARTGKSTDDPRAGIGIGEDGDPMFSLQSGKQHAVSFTQNQREEIRKLYKAGSVSSIRRGDAKQETLIAFTGKDHGQDAQRDVSPTLRSMNHEGGNANVGGQVAVAFQRRIGRNGRGKPEEISPTLSGADAGATSDMRPCVATSVSVRRLTPRECERLQGFPDDWTQWDVSGKEISDSARYRMLGNAVTVPVAEWIAHQILKFV